MMLGLGFFNCLSTRKLTVKASVPRYCILISLIHCFIFLTLLVVSDAWSTPRTRDLLYQYPQLNLLIRRTPLQILDTSSYRPF